MSKTNQHVVFFLILLFCFNTGLKMFHCTPMDSIAGSRPWLGLDSY